MPITVKIDPVRRLVCLTCSGTLTDEDVNGARQQELESEALKPDFDQIIDVRNIGQFEVTSKAVVALVASDPYGSGSRRVFVTPRDIAFGTARMFQAMRGDKGDELNVFRSWDEAMDWLGTDLPDSEAG